MKKKEKKIKVDKEVLAKVYKELIEKHKKVFAK